MSRCFWVLGAAVGLVACEPGSSSAVDDDTDLALSDSASGDTDLSDTDDSVVDTDDTGDTVDTDAGCPDVSESTVSAIVTDIDETLTTSDLEWVNQIIDPSHDPEMRPDANTVMQAWHDRGYRIFYVTARGESLSLLDGTPARDATYDWLDAHGFPFEPGDVFLASGLGETGDGAANYKTETLEALKGDGYELLYAYGNADTDVTAYKNVGVADDHDFLVGDLAGDYGVVGVTNEEAYTTHLLTWPAAAPCGY